MKVCDYRTVQPLALDEPWHLMVEEESANVPTAVEGDHQKLDEKAATISEGRCYAGVAHGDQHSGSVRRLASGISDPFYFSWFMAGSTAGKTHGSIQRLQGQEIGHIPAQLGLFSADRGSFPQNPGRADSNQPDLTCAGVPTWLESNDCAIRKEIWMISPLSSFDLLREVQIATLWLSLTYIAQKQGGRLGLVPVRTEAPFFNISAEKAYRPWTTCVDPKWDDSDPTRNKTTQVVRSVFQIFVKMPKGSTIVIWTQDSDRVSDLKTKIANQTGYPAEIYHLLNEGRSMQEDSTMQEYNIKPGSTIILNMRLRGGAASAGTSSQSKGSFKEAVKGKGKNHTAVPEPPGQYIVDQMPESPSISIEIPEVNAIYSDLQKK